MNEHPYASRFAELYDLFYSHKPYSEETSWLESKLPRPPARLLDVACGTGNHAMALASSGHEVTGVDASPEMLALAQRKASARGLPVTFILQDMRRLEFPASSFDAAICLFDSIGYVLTDDAVKEVLSRVREVLQANGVFILEFWHLTAMTTRYEPVRIRRLDTPTGRVLRISETELIEDECLARVAYTVLELNDDGSYSTTEEIHMNRYFTIEEMEGLLRGTGFLPMGWYSGFHDIPVNDEAWHVVAVIRAI